VFRNNIDRTGDRFKLEDFKIVNGCQTSNIIFDLFYGEEGGESGEPDLAEAIQVPFRLIGLKDDDFVSSIVVDTNRQNPVRDEQFWALRPFKKSLEEYCRNLDSEEIILLERRDNQCRNQDIERTRVMQPSVLMKAVAARLLFQPQRLVEITAASFRTTKINLSCMARTFVYTMRSHTFIIGWSSCGEINELTTASKSFATSSWLDRAPNNRWKRRIYRKKGKDDRICGGNAKTLQGRRETKRLRYKSSKGHRGPA
jgi:AIPR protein